MQLHTDNRGMTLILVSVFIIIFVLISVAGVNYVISTTKAVRHIQDRVAALYLAEAGIAKTLFCLNHDIDLDCGGIAGLLYPGENNVSFGAGTFSTTVTDDGQDKIIEALGTTSSGATREIRVVAFADPDSTAVSFNFGVQTDEGGFDINNTATVNGNLFSNGPVSGANANLVAGDIVSAGPSGLIDDISLTGTARAHTIQNTTVGGDAYYQVLSGSTVAGTQFPGSMDEATTTLPIPDSAIELWKQDAAMGTVYSSPCPYIIDADASIGPAIIECDLEIDGNPTITIAGAIWVKGTITVKNSPTIRLDASFGSASTGFIADNESDRLTSSKIDVNNSATFVNSGTPGSYIFLISQNNSAENGGGETAIEMQNSANGDLLVYAGHGEILIKNTVNLRQVTGYGITMENNTVINYESGLASTLFATGPGGIWRVRPQTWISL